MKIIELNIIQFGKFKDKIFNLDEGFNLVKGDNESGKSTLLGFIKFVLYGVGRKNPNIAVGDRERAVSWNTGFAAGSIVIEHIDGKKYRIERNGRETAKGNYNDKAKIFDLSIGEYVLEGEIPGEVFLGINAQAYDSMCNIKQLEAVAVTPDAVRGVIDNLLSSGDENTNVQSALKMLDTERRRLLHTNGKGGLVYESETALDKLVSEYKGAKILENEKIKNHDELDRVIVALAKAKDEFDVAQRMCDVHDDVLRLKKFDTLSEYKKEAEELSKKSSELDLSAGFDTARADYEYAARIKSLASSLDRSALALEGAKKELSETETALSKMSSSDSKGFAEIIDEFGTPSAAVMHLASKKKKRSSTGLYLTVCGVASAMLFAFALAIAFAMNNIAGASTVGFIGLVLLILAITFYKKYASAKSEIVSFMDKMGKDYCSKNEEKILSSLEEFYGNISERTRLSNAKESAKFRLGMANDAYLADLSAASGIAQELNISCSDSELSKNLLSAAESMNSYLVKRAAIDAQIRENQALTTSLKSELERYSERDLRAKITPEIIEKIEKIPFEQLKAERDSALYKTNQYNQYKASIERNLAATGNKRSADDIFPEIEDEKERLATLKLRLDAVKLASEVIESASSDLKSDVTPRIRANAESNLSTMTSGKYSELYIDDNMGLSVFVGGATRPIDSLSKGSLDAAYFSVRLALLQTLLAEKNPPIYMDETLSQLDDGRAKNTLKLVMEYSKNAQCILFTCQNRDLELAKEIGNVNLIEL